MHLPMDIPLPEHDWLTVQSAASVAPCLHDPPGPISEPLGNTGSHLETSSPLEEYQDERAWSESIVHWADEHPVNFPPTLPG